MSKIEISPTNNVDIWEDMVREHRNAPHHGPDFLTWHSGFIVRFHELLKKVPEHE